jgi:hypothetical protein
VCSVFGVRGLDLVVEELYIRRAFCILYILINHLVLFSLLGALPFERKGEVRCVSVTLTVCPVRMPASGVLLNSGVAHVLCIYELSMVCFCDISLLILVACRPAHV